MRNKASYFVAFLTGFAMMGYEILGVRAVTPYFGGSVYVWGAIIAVVLAGLSFGYAWGGRLAERDASQTRTLLKLIIASATLIVFFPIYGYGIANLIYRINLDVRVGALLVGLSLFVAPCVFMGAVMPILVKLLTLRGTPPGIAAGNVYAASTVGSIGGTLFTSFFLISWVGVATGMVLLGLLQACGLLVCISGKMSFMKSMKAGSG